MLFPPMNIKENISCLSTHRQFNACHAMTQCGNNMVYVTAELLDFVFIAKRCTIIFKLVFIHLNIIVAFINFKIYKLS